MVSAIPDKPGTMIDPGFVSYKGTVPEAISIESEMDHRHQLHLLQTEKDPPLEPTAASLPSLTEMHSAVGLI